MKGNIHRVISLATPLAGIHCHSNVYYFVILFQPFFGLYHNQNACIPAATINPVIWVILLPIRYISISQSIRLIAPICCVLHSHSFYVLQKSRLMMIPVQ